MEEIYGEFGASLGDRVKKRRRINYCEDDDEDDGMTVDEPDSKQRRRRNYSDDSRSPSPEGSFVCSLFFFRGVITLHMCFACRKRTIIQAGF